MKWQRGVTVSVKYANGDPIVIKQELGVDLGTPDISYPSKKMGKTNISLPEKEADNIRPDVLVSMALPHPKSVEPKLTSNIQIDGIPNPALVPLSRMEASEDRCMSRLTVGFLDLEITKNERPLGQYKKHGAGAQMDATRTANFTSIYSHPVGQSKTFYHGLARSNSNATTQLGTNFQVPKQPKRKRNRREKKKKKDQHHAEEM